MREFYKTIHPDTLEQAPTRVREENLRSLKYLNDYMDRLKGNLGCEKLKLKFYAPEKTNEKSKKYLYFEVKLDGFEPNSEQDFLKLLEMKAGSLLSGSLNAARLSANPFADEAKAPETKKDAEAEATPKPIDPFEAFPEQFRKSSSKNRKIREMNEFKAKFGAFEREFQKEETIKDIQKNLIVTYPYLKHSNTFAQQIYNELSTTHLSEEIFHAKFDPKLFYVKEGTVMKDLVTFMKDLEQFLHKYLDRYLSIQNQLLKLDPKVKVMLTYEQATIPGFICIDIRDEIKKSVEFISQNIGDALDKRDNVFDQKSIVENYKSILLERHQLNNIDLGSEYSLEEDGTKVFLFLKKVDHLLKELRSKSFKCRGMIIKLVRKDEVITPAELSLRWNFRQESVMEPLIVRTQETIPAPKVVV